MSTENPVLATLTSKEDPILSVREGVQVRLAEFGPKSENKGSKFCYAEYTSLDALVNAFSEHKDGVPVPQSGVQAILDLINPTIKTRISQKVSSQLPKNVAADVRNRLIEEKIANDPHRALFSVEQAFDYKPGERTPGLKKQLAELTARLVGTFDPTNPEAFMALVAQIKNIQAQLAETAEVA